MDVMQSGSGWDSAEKIAIACKPLILKEINLAKFLTFSLTRIRLRGMLDLRLGIPVAAPRRGRE